MRGIKEEIILEGLHYEFTGTDVRRMIEAIQHARDSQRKREKELGFYKDSARTEQWTGLIDKLKDELSDLSNIEAW